MEAQDFIEVASSLQDTINFTVTILIINFESLSIIYILLYDIIDSTQVILI